ncbi:hypothetical protein ACWGRV_14950 [Streptomyces sp. NPDC055663]
MISDFSGDVGVAAAEGDVGQVWAAGQHEDAGLLVGLAAGVQYLLEVLADQGLGQGGYVT